MTFNDEDHRHKWNCITFMVFVICLTTFGVAHCQDIGTTPPPEPEHLYLKNAVYTEKDPLVIEGKYLKNSGIMDCENIIFRKCNMVGGFKIEGSLDKGCKNILFENCYIHDNIGNRLLWVCGNRLEKITFNGCKIVRSIKEYHVAYFSAGHWQPNEETLCKGFNFIQCIFGWCPGGRNDFQFNGRFEDILIDGCIFPHGQLNGLTCIGCQGVIVRNSVFYGSNRGCLIIKNYIDSAYWTENGTKDYPPEKQAQGDPEKYSYDHWKKTHHKNKNILIENNTLMVGPKAFYKGPWNHEDDPTDGHPAIAIVNSVPWPEYASENIFIRNNIIHTPNSCIIQIDEKEAPAVNLMNNMVWVTKPGWPYVSYLEKLNHHQGNWIEDPSFTLPYYWYIDGFLYPDFPWDKHKSIFDHQTYAYAKYGVGAPCKVPGEDAIK